MRPAGAEGVDRGEGWRAVGGAFLLLLCGWTAIYAYAAFAPALARAAGVTETAVCVVHALAGGGCFLTGALSGPLADRTGARAPSALGMVLVALGLLLAAGSDGLVGLALTFGLMVGIGVGLAYVPAMAAVQCRFAARRGLASGIAATGIGVATLLVPAGAVLLAPLGDWRVQMRLMAGAVLVFGLAGAALLPAAVRGPAAPPGPALATVRRSRAFQRLYGAVMLVSIPAALPFAWLPRSAEAIGMGPRDALGLLGIVGVGSMLGRVAIGHLADRVGRGATLLSCCVGVSLSMPVWACAGEGALAAFALAFGALQGGFVTLCPAVTVDLFGRRSAAGACGLLFTGRGVALLLAAPSVALASPLVGEAAAIAGAGLCGLAGCALLRDAVAPARCRVAHPTPGAAGAPWGGGAGRRRRRALPWPGAARCRAPEGGAGVTRRRGGEAFGHREELGPECRAIGREALGRSPPLSWRMRCPPSREHFQRVRELDKLLPPTLPPMKTGLSLGPGRTQWRNGNRICRASPLTGSAKLAAARAHRVPS